MPRNPSIRSSRAQPGDGPADPETLLTPEQIRRRRRELWISATVFALLAALLLLQPIYGITQAVTGSGLFLFLNALRVFCILLLSFLVARSFWKLIGERRRGILGSHLNLNFVSAFVVLAFVASTGLFVVSAFFITDSIDRWFSVQVDSALEQSGEVAESYYESMARAALADGEAIGAAIAVQGLLAEGRLAHLSDFVQARQREHRLAVIEVYAADGEERAIAINPEVPAVNSFERVGGTETIHVDVRVIAATNKDLDKEIAAGSFREDLYYRLDVIPLHVSPLRERREDVPILARSFVEEFCADSEKRAKRLSPAALRALQQHPWPGNVRELRNLMERLVIMSPGSEIDASDLPAEFGGVDPPAASGSTLDDARRAFEREYLMARLREHAWNISRTAEPVGIARESLSRKVKALGIEIERG